MTTIPLPAISAPGPWARLLLIGALFLPMLAQAQLPEALPKPDLKLWTNGAVNVVAKAADGSIVFGGNFLAVNGQPRRHLARLLPNGSLDPVWNPGANNSVNAIAIDDANGAIFVGGFFTEIGGQSRNRIAKLSSTGVGAANFEWNPGADGSVDALVLHGASALYAGGTFTTIGQQLRGRVAKIATTGGGAIDPTWDPNVGGSVLALAYDSGANALYVGGDFNVIQGSPRAAIGKVEGSGNGIVDATWDPGSGNTVTSLDFDGTWLYAGGFFIDIANQPHAGIARISPVDGTGDGTWNPSVAGGDVLSIARNGTALYLAGSFTDVNGQLRPSLARISTINGALDTNFIPDINASVNHVAAFGDGNVYIGGPLFTDISGVVRLGFAVLDTTGGPLAAVNVLNGGSVFALVRLPDQSMLVGGNFFFADNESRRNLLKLTPEGLLDPTWMPQTDGFVLAFALDASRANVYASGTFLNANGQPRRTLAKIATAGSGTLDAGWNALVDGSVLALAVANDDSVYVGGTFTQIAGGLRTNIARLAGANGQLDGGWNALGANGEVRTLAVAPAPNGSIFVSGVFTTINGQTRAGLAKLDASSGAADLNWSADLNDQRLVRSMLFANDALYLGGGFSSVGGIARSNLAKISIGGGAAVVDPSWAPVADAEVEAMALGSDATALYAVGGFTMIDGEPRSRIAKIATTGSGLVDPLWAPDVYGSYLGAVAIDAQANVMFGGFFNQVGSTPRQGIAAVGRVVVFTDALFADSFE